MGPRTQRARPAGTRPRSPGTGPSRGARSRLRNARRSECRRERCGCRSRSAAHRTRSGRPRSRARPRPGPKAHGRGRQMRQSGAGLSQRRRDGRGPHSSRALPPKAPPGLLVVVPVAVRRNSCPNCHGQSSLWPGPSLSESESECSEFPCTVVVVVVVSGRRRGRSDETRAQIIAVAQVRRNRRLGQRDCVPPMLPRAVPRASTGVRDRWSPAAVRASSRSSCCSSTT